MQNEVLEPPEELLKRVKAMIIGRVITREELAWSVLPNQAMASAKVTIARWTKGKQELGAESYIKLAEFAAEKTLEISRSPKKAQAYREAFATL